MVRVNSFLVNMRWLGLATAGLAIVLAASTSAHAQLAGQHVAQPFFDFPNWARWDTCRPRPLVWGFDPYPYYQACDPTHCGDCNNGPNSCPEPPAPFVAHRPNNWYATAEFAPLFFDPNHDIEVARFGATGPTLLTTSALDNDFDSGGKFTVGRTIGLNYRVEGTYLGAYSWSDEVSITDFSANGIPGGAGNIASFLSGFSGVTDLDDSSFLSVGNVSSLYGAEVNVRYWLDMPPGPFDFSFLVGGRYLNMDESFSFSTIADSPGLDVTNDLAVQTSNELYGLQIGVEMAWMVHPRFWLNIDLKGAMCNNRASQASTFGVTDGGVLDEFETDASEDVTAYIGDFAVVGCWQMTPSMVFRIGYQALFVNGLALGMDNAQTDNFLLRNGPGQLDDSGEVAYHGPVIGFTWAR